MFTDPIRFWRRTRPNCIAVVDRARDQRYSYAELDAAIDRAAAMLRGLGAGAGSRVGTLALNRIEQIHLFYACHRVGAALVPFNWRLSADELAAVLRDADPLICFGETRFRSLAEAAQLSVRWIDLDAPDAISVVHADEAKNSADDPALILYTSGSSGRPKGAVLPHRQILFNAVATTSAWQLTHEDAAVITTPFFHTGGWNVFATPLWQRGGRVVLLEKFEADELLRTLAEERCTVALTVPTQLQMLLECEKWGIELPSLRSFFSGGAPCPGSVLTAVRAAGYAVREGYGLTECGPNCFTIAAEQAIDRPGVVGWPVPFLEMRTVNEDLVDADAGMPGELLLRGPQLFAGYLNDPVRTREAIIADGWLRTGDLAIRHADGSYSIAGRRKEMFISGGENVYPGEVEAMLCTCPGIAEVAVIGVADQRWGEVGQAFVVLRPGATLAERDVLDFAKQRMAHYKAPRRVRFVAALPRLGSGKIDRQALIQWQ